MNIHQFSVTFVPEQDRVLMRVSTVEGDEIRMWLTRRLMIRLWPVLAGIQKERLLKQDAATFTADAPAPLQEMMADFQKEKALQQADFATPYREATRSKATEQPPLLVTHAEARPEPAGSMHLRFEERLSAPGQDRSVKLSLGGSEFHGVMHLMELAMRAAQWWEAAAGGAEGSQSGQQPQDEAASDERVLN